MLSLSALVVSGLRCDAATCSASQNVWRCGLYGKANRCVVDVQPPQAPNSWCRCCAWCRCGTGKKLKSASASVALEWATLDRFQHLGDWQVASGANGATPKAVTPVPNNKTARTA
jgi:hypothetical protein